ncbi:MAG TPA: hypothetical protein VNK95_06420 [Caldilineaceae bacterium]|nr:hypothetical protein [Caldilineaceae bacterium]
MELTGVEHQINPLNDLACRHHHLARACNAGIGGSRKQRPLLRQSGYMPQEKQTPLEG